MTRAALLFILMTFSLPSSGRVTAPDTIIEKADLVHYKAPKPQSNWGLLKSWVKKKVADFNQPKPENKKPVPVPVPQKTETEIAAEKLENQLPSYKSAESVRGVESIKEYKKGLAEQESLATVSPGRPAQSDLKKTKQGVPYFSLYNKKSKKLKSGKTKVIKVKVKDLPKLDVGEEAKISASSYALNNIQIFDVKSQKANRLKGPANLYKTQKKTWLAKKMKVVKPPRKIKNKDFGLATPVTLAIVEKIVPQLNPDNPVTMADYNPMTVNQLNLLASNILLQNGTENCHLVAGLLDHFTNNSFYGEEANFHLGVCAHEMGFYSESTDRLIRVIQKENPDYTPKAVELLVSHLPREYEVAVAKAILNIKNKALIPADSKDNMNYVLAKAMSTQRKFTKALNYAGLVGNKSKHYANSRFIMGVSKYALGRPLEATQILKDIRKWMDKTNKRDKHLSSLIAVNLGRINFQIKKYKESHEEYQKVGKSHSLWVQALVEQGWVQLHLNDPAGAIGNMYSLHSPYFKGVFIPESFAVRTIGYLNICQYGDAYQTLELMEAKYKPWVNQVGRYVQNTKQKKQYYKTIKTYLKGKSTATVDGIPYQVIREIARHRNFLNSQDSINQKSEEMNQFSNINSLIQRDKSKVRRRIRIAREQIAENKKLIKAAKKNKELVAKVNGAKRKIRFNNDLVMALKFQVKLFEDSRKKFMKMKRRVTKRLSKETYALREKAGRALAVNMRESLKNMKAVLANNEFLRYEVFSGSGEVIRYKAAGGKSSQDKRLPASIKPQKTLTWSVTGEYWEDEIGNYRSALRNNCPRDNRRGLPPARQSAKVN